MALVGITDFKKKKTLTLTYVNHFFLNQFTKQNVTLQSYIMREKNFLGKHLSAVLSHSVVELCAKCNVT